MGQGLSKKSKVVSQVCRKPGEFLNTMNFPADHVETVYPPMQPAKKISVCRCWQSANFPICDNAHQQLQKQGIRTGPVMLELRNSHNRQLGSLRSTPSSSSGGFRIAGGQSPSDLSNGTVKIAASIVGSALAAATGWAHYAGLI
eukprot:GHVQ01015993.1.p1 GENE.GHVQ01015993.1~~GHVQ01015993.1.p1  ORF type:complete len:144 (-),score=16.87 GHVQ01015993.1:452-883(-)